MAHAGLDMADEEYLAFCATHGRRHADQAEYDMRLKTYSMHKALIEETNAANRTYKLAANKFADWTQVCFPELAQQPLPDLNVEMLQMHLGTALRPSSRAFIW